MRGLYLTKYPVKSKSGREYRVDVCDDHIYRGYVTIRVYEAREGRSIFGKNKIKLIKVSGGSVNREIYDERNWGYDYVRIAQHAVEKYEESLRDRENHKLNRNIGAKKFNEWSGEATE